MRRRRSFRREGGFSLIEMMTAALIFLIISGLAFSLLELSQRRYQRESVVTNSFQEARLGLDQIIRDINVAGYPPINQFQFGPNTPSLQQYATSGFAWSPNYPTVPACKVGACTTPGNFDLIVETQIPGQCAGGGVSWIRYQLIGTTLYRTVACKQAGDPVAATDATNSAPFVQNVVNGAVPIFSYFCNNSATPSVLAACQDASVTDQTATNIVAIGVRLMVQAPVPDPQTGLPIRVELNGRGARVIPLQ
jgi:prepilin-type N-terminal cleavage/methylation domain-containing protein